MISEINKHLIVMLDQTNMKELIAMIIVALVQKKIQIIQRYFRWSIGNIVVIIVDVICNITHITIQKVKKEGWKLILDETF